MTRTTGVQVRGNVYDKVGVPLQTGVEVTGLAFEPLPPPAPSALLPAVTKLPDAIDALLPPGSRRGRDTIIVDEWGPYNYKSPKIWPAGKLTDRPLKLRVLGPAGTWSLKSTARRHGDVEGGPVPGEIVVTPPGPTADLTLTLEYRRGRGHHTSRPGISGRRSRPVLVRAVRSRRQLVGEVVDLRRGIRPDRGSGRVRGKLTAAPVKTETLPRLDSFRPRSTRPASPTTASPCAPRPTSGSPRFARDAGAERRWRARVGGRDAGRGPLVGARDCRGPRRSHPGPPSD